MTPLEPITTVSNENRLPPFPPCQSPQVFLYLKYIGDTVKNGYSYLKLKAYYYSSIFLIAIMLTQFLVY